LWGRVPPPVASGGWPHPPGRILSTLPTDAHAASGHGAPPDGR